MDLQETNRELECQRLSFITRISMDRQRERINFCGELEMINRLSKKVAQEIAWKLWNYEECVANKQIEQD